MTRRLTRSAVALLLLLATHGVTVAPAGERRAAPAIAGRDLDGARIDLAALRVRGPVVVSFWATWCKPCLKELPALQALIDSTGGEVTLITINEDGPRNRAKLRPFVRRLGLTAPVVPDDDGAIAEAYQVLACPTTVVIDTSGAIVAVHRGYRPGDEAEVAADLARLRAGVAPADSSAVR